MGAAVGAVLRQEPDRDVGTAPLANFGARVRFETRAARGDTERALALLDHLDANE